MSKIICIGLGRTGTTSLCKALEILGFSTVHYPHDPKKALQENDAVADETVAACFEELAELYPDAKFIYTIRNAINWADSYARCFQKLDPDHQQHPVVVRTYQTLYGTDEFDRAAWIHGFVEHDIRVREFFEKSQAAFLEFEAIQGWAPLCPFLGVEIPETPFPWLNAS